MLRDHYGEPIAIDGYSEHLWSQTAPPSPVVPHPFDVRALGWWPWHTPVGPAAPPPAPVVDAARCASEGCPRRSAAVRVDTHPALGPFCALCRQRARAALASRAIKESELATYAAKATTPNVVYGTLPDEKATVARVRELRAQRFTLGEIVARIAAEGHRSRRGKVHSQSRVFAMMSRGWL